MLEFIGGVVVAWFVFTLVRGAWRAWYSMTISEAKKTAIAIGVPASFVHQLRLNYITVPGIKRELRRMGVDIPRYGRHNTHNQCSFIISKLYELSQTIESDDRYESSANMR